jgi:putative hydrolase of the HAD superfamily
VIAHILFDLDNTLYPASSGFEQKTVSLMIQFAAEHIGKDLPETMALRAEGFKKFGTTLEWLRQEYGPVDVETYYSRVHPEGEEIVLCPDPELRDILVSDPRPKSIFTNSPREHADRVLKRLGIRDLFQAVYDIRFFGFRGKPAPEAYLKVLGRIGLEPGAVAFFDDSPRAVRAFADMGGHAFLVDETGEHDGTGLPSLPLIHQYRTILRS